ncbi:hypothetical protein SAMN06297422_10548 [Lachnospiraceae bacterium]|nr:hypothetical protein SAMN06297422_10548 [Lachnospiraceae bacterium]
MPKKPGENINDITNEFRDKLKGEQNLTAEEVQYLNSHVDNMAVSVIVSDHDQNDYSVVMSEDPDVKKTNQDIYTAAGFLGTRESTMRSMFIIWLMGSKDMDVKAAIGVLRGENNQKYVEDFVKFCQDNPMNPESEINKDVKADKYSKAAKNWADIMKRSTAKMQEYTIPDIDYFDREMAKDYYDELSIVGNLMIDFNQEFFVRMGNYTIPKGTGSDNKVYEETKSSEYIQKYVGGELEAKKMANFWVGYQKVFDNMISAVGNAMYYDEWQSGDIGTIKKTINSRALDDMLFRTQFQEIKGKKLGDISKFDIKRNNNINDIKYSIRPQIEFGNFEIEQDKVIDYLTGKDTNGFINDINVRYIQPQLGNKKTEIVGLSAAKAFFRSISRSNEMLIPLTQSSGDDAASVKDFVRLNKHLIREPFDYIFDENMYNYAEDLELDPIDLFRVDDKSPTELWGEKYADVTDSTEKRFLLKAEILKKAIKGDSEITIKVAKIGKDNAFISKKEMIAVPKRADLEEMAEGIEIYNGLLDKLTEKVGNYQTRLAETQKSPDNNFKNKTAEGSEPYQAMCTALKELSTYLSKSKTDRFNMEGLRTKLSDFQRAGETYFKRGKTSNRERLAVAGEVASDMETYMNALNDAFNDFDKRYPADLDGNTIDKTSKSSIEWQINSLAVTYNKVKPLKKLSKEQKDAKINEALERGVGIADINTKIPESFSAQVSPEDEYMYITMFMTKENHVGDWKRKNNPYMHKLKSADIIKDSKDYEDQFSSYYSQKLADKIHSFKDMEEQFSHMMAGYVKNLALVGKNFKAVYDSLDGEEYQYDKALSSATQIGVFAMAVQSDDLINEISHKEPFYNKFKELLGYNRDMTFRDVYKKLGYTAEEIEMLTKDEPDKLDAKPWPDKDMDDDNKMYSAIGVLSEEYFRILKYKSVQKSLDVVSAEEKEYYDMAIKAYEDVNVKMNKEEVKNKQDALVAWHNEKLDTLKKLEVKFRQDQINQLNSVIFGEKKMGVLEKDEMTGAYRALYNRKNDYIGAYLKNEPEAAAKADAVLNNQAGYAKLGEKSRKPAVGFKSYLMLHTGLKMGRNAEEMVENVSKCMAAVLLSDKKFDIKTIHKYAGACKEMYSLDALKNNPKKLQSMLHNTESLIAASNELRNTIYGVSPEKCDRYFEDMKMIADNLSTTSGHGKQYKKLNGLIKEAAGLKNKNLSPKDFADEIRRLNVAIYGAALEYINSKGMNKIDVDKNPRAAAALNAISVLTNSTEGLSFRTTKLITDMRQALERSHNNAAEKFENLNTFKTRFGTNNVNSQKEPEVKMQPVGKQTDKDISKK